MSPYPKKAYEVGSGCAPLYPGRTMNHLVWRKAKLPCTAIVVHGVNDVGVAYGAVEAGLCAGMAERMKLPGAFKPVGYRNFTPADRDQLEDDPDAVFFKRMPTADAHSFVIPFYWGFREQTRPVKTKAGQFTDRHGNRLDKDYSKEGGPFANATNSLPDMWNRGFGGAYGVIDSQAKDPLRPVLDGPGRMYMVLAALRLAALVQMIRDYDPDETVNLVAHSQGCMLSLLAQAFLLQKHQRPADALILNNPPYSLVDELPFVETLGSCFSGGTDEAMKAHYGSIAGIQTLQARLKTLANIVQGVATHKHNAPDFHHLQGPAGCTVGTKWEAAQDRDNRGKVYLYFCPEDATVRLNTMQGIGWQGVPDVMVGSQLKDTGKRDIFFQPIYKAQPITLKPLPALGKGFLQRVFTQRLRTPAKGGGAPQPVLVGAPPHDFALRIDGEDDDAFVNADLTSRRAHSPAVQWPPQDRFFGVVPKPELWARDGIRSITGEALHAPVKADLEAGAVPGSGGRNESVDGIDAAIAPTSDYGAQDVWALIDDPHEAPVAFNASSPLAHSPQGQTLYSGPVTPVQGQHKLIAKHINTNATTASQHRDVQAVYACVDTKATPWRLTGKLLVRCKESADECRLRWQHATVSRSFHSAIFGSQHNHEHVTAYDLAIGQGKAVSDPNFRDYLCAVADWRLKKIDIDSPSSVRPGILTWDRFLKKHGDYYNVEPDDRKRLISDTCSYYSTGVLPKWLPVLPDGLPPMVLSETRQGQRIDNSKAKPQQAAQASEPWDIDESMKQQDKGRA